MFDKAILLSQDVVDDIGHGIYNRYSSWMSTYYVPHKGNYNRYYHKRVEKRCYWKGLRIGCPHFRKATKRLAKGKEIRDKDLKSIGELDYFKPAHLWDMD